MNTLAIPDALLPGLTALAILLPLLLAFRPAATGWAALAPLPTLLLALGPAFEVRVDALILGARFGIHPGNAPLLLLASLLWATATWFARHYMAHDHHAARYHVFHRLAMTGNLGLLLAQDIGTFYFFFAMMSLSSYPLVIHDGRRESRFAGRIYLALALLGEILQFAAFSFIAATATDWSFDSVRAAVIASPRRDTILVLALLGFGIKAALVPLHVWLPLAHPVAPTPASAVLSGSMIKAGLVGWMVVLPLGAVGVPHLGEPMIVAGLIGAFGAAIAGVTQRQPKAVLAYSSISQMGLMILAVGIGLARPDAMKYVFPAVALYAVHHALAKGALFLGVGMAASAPRAAAGRAALWAGLALAALALAGFPFTSGAPAKVFLKTAAAEAPGDWADLLAVLLSLGAIGTTLLMARFLWTLRKKIAHTPDAHHLAARGIWLPWLALLALMVSVPWWVAAQFAPEKTAIAASMKYAGALSWPIGAGVLAAVAAIFFVRKRAVEVPPGDVLVIGAWLIARAVRFYRLHRPTLGARVRAADEARTAARAGLKNVLRALAGTERYLRTLGVAGIALALLTALLIWRLGG
ncbi:MAG TPA: complex I subunit 5 family protein [Kiritimatiellia bacterium]|nr:complex I subunit 5 family protein [Kiritimatiellia bacterium]